MTNTRAKFIALFTLIPALCGVFFMLRSAETHAASDPCAITKSDVATIDKAAEIGLLTELTARKALLARLIACATADARSLQSNLNNLSVPSDAKPIQSQLSGRVTDAIAYYNLEFAKVSGAGIAGTQGIAREVLTWRSSNYEPLAMQVDNFSFWASNQTLFKVANDRLGGITNLVSFIQEAGANSDLEAGLAGAQSLMQAANNENTTARNAFMQSLPPDETLALTKQSLQTLSSAYQQFFAIATLVQKLLPTSTDK